MFTIVLLGACSGAAGPATSADPGSGATSTLQESTTSIAISPTTLVPTTDVPPTAATTTTGAPSTTTTSLPPGVTEPPAWLGTRLLPVRPDGLGEVQPTPEELVDRRFTSPDLLPPPPGNTFTATNTAVPEDVLARSTWSDGCPVGVDDLRYVTATFWGFDQRAHTGEVLVNARYADELVEVLEAMFEARFPIEEMRITRTDELDLPPTGDGNVTTAFVCRPAVGSSNWSQHAYGLAIDINPFHNPYVKRDLVIPELASAYVDRSEVRPGMILAGDVVTDAFAAIGWGWGGEWNSLVDTMHFSASGT